MANSKNTGHRTSASVSVSAPTNTGDVATDAANIQVNDSIKRTNRITAYLQDKDFFGSFIVATAVVDDMLANIIKTKVDGSIHSTLFGPTGLNLAFKVKILKDAGMMPSGFKTILTKMLEVRNLFAHNDKFDLDEVSGTVFIDDVAKYFGEMKCQKDVDIIKHSQKEESWEDAITQCIIAILNYTIILRNQAIRKGLENHDGSNQPR